MTWINNDTSRGDIPSPHNFKFQKPQEFPKVVDPWETKGKGVEDYVKGFVASVIEEQKKNQEIKKDVPSQIADFVRNFLAKDGVNRMECLSENQWLVAPFFQHWWKKREITLLCEYYSENMNKLGIRLPVTFSAFLNAVSEYHNWLWENSPKP